MKHLILLFLFSTSGFSKDYYLYCGKILDVTTGKELINKTIVVSNTKITKIEDGFISKAKADDIEIDLKNKYVLPRLIDFHVHLETVEDSRAYTSEYLDNEADVALESVQYLKLTLLAGFTTVRNLGGSGINISLRTITAGKEVVKNSEIKGFYPKIVVPKAREVGPEIQSTFAKAYKKGVKIAFGTDAGVYPHRLNAKELLI